jgi:hypothetical protein
MESRSFGIIEDRISKKIQQVTQDILMENLIEEVKATMAASCVHDDNDFQLWKYALEDHPGFVLSTNKYPLLMCSFDMGWQQRSSGNRYNSQSGHALMVGGITRKPIAMVIKSKRCNYCLSWKKRNKDLLVDGEDLLLPLHDCTRNHEGSSSSMESHACLEMVVDLHDKYHFALWTRSVQTMIQVLEPFSSGATQTT